MRRVWIVLATACSSPAKPSVPEPPAKPAPVDLSRAACDKPHDWRPTHSFVTADRVAHLRVKSARWGPEWEQHRCGFVELELVDALRGTLPKTSAIVISQATITRYTSRPAGAWWVVEQPLEPGTEYVAFCPPGASLEGTCTIANATTTLADVRFARDAEKHDLAGVLQAAAQACAQLGHVAATYVWERFRAEATKDATTYGKIVGLVEMPACDVRFRDALFHAVQEPALADSLPHATRLAQAMFQLLSLPSAVDLQDNLVGTWLPAQLGLDGNRKLTARQVFGTDVKRRTDAALALGKLKHPQAVVLLDWIRR